MKDRQADLSFSFLVRFLSPDYASIYFKYSFLALNTLAFFHPTCTIRVNCINAKLIERDNDLHKYTYLFFH